MKRILHIVYVLLLSTSMWAEWGEMPQFEFQTNRGLPSGSQLPFAATNGAQTIYDIQLADLAAQYDVSPKRMQQVLQTMAMEDEWADDWEDPFMTPIGDIPWIMIICMLVMYLVIKKLKSTKHWLGLSLCLLCCAPICADQWDLTGTDATLRNAVRSAEGSTQSPYNLRIATTSTTDNASGVYLRSCGRTKGNYICLSKIAAGIDNLDLQFTVQNSGTGQRVFHFYMYILPEGQDFWVANNKDYTQLDHADYDFGAWTASDNESRTYTLYNIDVTRFTSGCSIYIVMVGQNADASQNSRDVFVKNVMLFSQIRDRLSWNFTGMNGEAMFNVAKSGTPALIGATKLNDNGAILYAGSKTAWNNGIQMRAYETSGTKTETSNQFVKVVIPASTSSREFNIKTTWNFSSTARWYRFYYGIVPHGTEIPNGKVMSYYDSFTIKGYVSSNEQVSSITKEYTSGNMTIASNSEGWDVYIWNVSYSNADCSYENRAITYAYLQKVLLQGTSESVFSGMGCAEIYSVTCVQGNQGSDVVLTQSKGGGTIKLPTASEVGKGHAFVGWSRVNTINGEPSSYIPGGSTYRPTCDETLYPLYYYGDQFTSTPPSALPQVQVTYNGSQLAYGEGVIFYGFNGQSVSHSFTVTATNFVKGATLRVTLQGETGDFRIDGYDQSYEFVQTTDFAPIVKTIKVTYYPGAETSWTDYRKMYVKEVDDADNQMQVWCNGYSLHQTLTITTQPTSYVTTTSNNPIRLTDPLVVHGSDLIPGQTQLTFTTQSPFAICATSSGTYGTSFTVTASSKEQDFTYYVRYTPTSPTTTGDQGTVCAQITAMQSGEQVCSQTITGRGLSDRFVVAAKIDEQYFALPNNMYLRGYYRAIPVSTCIEGGVLTATAVPDLAVYSRWANYRDKAYFYPSWDTNGDYRLAVGDPSITPGDDAANNLVNASKYIDSEEDKWNSSRWILSTTDNVTYALASAYLSDQSLERRYLTMSSSYNWKIDTQSSPGIYLLPVSATNASMLQAVKALQWTGRSVTIQTDASSSQYVRVLFGGQEVVGPTLLSSFSTGAEGIYRIYPINPIALVNQSGKTITLQFGTMSGGVFTMTKQNALAIPCIRFDELKVETAQKASSYAKLEVVLLDSTTLAISSDIPKLGRVSVYPGSTLHVAHNLTLDGLELQGGYWYNELNQLKWGVPRVFVESGTTLALTDYSQPVDYFYWVDGTQSYALAVPFATPVSALSFDGIGAATAYNKKFRIRTYDGATRVSTGKTGWKTLDAGATLTPGLGYTLQYGKGSVLHYTHVPMTVNVNTLSAGTSNNQVAVTAHTMATAPDNDKGWNLIANPYMGLYSGSTGESAFSGTVELGYLEKNIVEGQWTGTYNLVNRTVRYATLPNAQGTDYTQELISSQKFAPFSSFFVQIGTTGTMTFSRTGEVLSAPGRFMSPSPESMVQLWLSHKDGRDNMGVLVGDAFSEDYELGDDLVKEFGSASVVKTYSLMNDGLRMAYQALPEQVAQMAVPVGYIAPVKDEYRMSIDSTLDISGLEHVYLSDLQTGDITDLLTDDYHFISEAGRVDDRLVLSVVRKQPAQPTQLVETNRSLLHTQPVYDVLGREVEMENYQGVMVQKGQKCIIR